MFVSFGVMCAKAKRKKNLAVVFSSCERRSYEEGRKKNNFYNSSTSNTHFSASTKKRGIVKICFVSISLPHFIQNILLGGSAVSLPRTGEEKLCIGLRGVLCFNIGGEALLQRKMKNFSVLVFMYSGAHTFLLMAEVFIDFPATFP